MTFAKNQNAKKNLRLIEVVIGSVFPPPPSKELRESRIELLRDELLEDDLFEEEEKNRQYIIFIFGQTGSTTADFGLNRKCIS